MYLHLPHIKQDTVPVFRNILGNQSLLQRMTTVNSKNPPSAFPGVLQRKITQDYNTFAQAMQNPAGTAPTLPLNRIQYIYAMHVLTPEIDFIKELYTRNFGWTDDTTQNDLLTVDKLDELLEFLTPIQYYMNLPLAERGPLLQNASQRLITALTPLWNQAPENCRQLETQTRYVDPAPASAPELQAQSNDIFESKGIALTADQKSGLEYVPQTVHMTVQEFRAEFHSPQLIQLLFDIYYTWRTNNGALDRRRTDRLLHAPENDGPANRQIPGVTTDNTPGAIRSFHGDAQNRLPVRTPAELAAPPMVATTYLNHAENTANTDPRRLNKTLMEYTGIRLGAEPNPHNNKIVFDYHTGIMYVTFNHYHMLYEVDMTTF